MSNSILVENGPAKKISAMVVKGGVAPDYKFPMISDTLENETIKSQYLIFSLLNLFIDQNHFPQNALFVVNGGTLQYVTPPTVDRQKLTYFADLDILGWE